MRPEKWGKHEDAGVNMALHWASTRIRCSQQAINLVAVPGGLPWSTAQQPRMVWNNSCFCQVVHHSMDKCRILRLLISSNL